MSVTGFLKRNQYWINDILHGSKVRKHYNEYKKTKKNKKEVC